MKQRLQESERISGHQFHFANTKTEYGHKMKLHIKYLFVIYWLCMFDARSLKYNVPRTAYSHHECWKILHYYFFSVKRKWQEKEKNENKICVETGLSFFYYFIFFSSVFSVLSVLILACWLIWWMPPNNVRLLFIRCIFVYLPLFSFLWVQCGLFLFLFVANSHSFVFDVFLIPFHSFLSFVRSVFLLLALLDPLTIINTEEGISLQKVNQITIISREHSKPLKWIECDHWLLYWIYFTLNVFTENLSASYRFVSLCCFGIVKLSRPPHNLLTLFTFNRANTDQWIYDELEHTVITTDKVLKFNG